MNTLKLIFTKKEYPYKDEVFDNKIIWGNIIINILSRESIVIEKAIDIEWDIRELVFWIRENKENILQDKLILLGKNKSSDSIAKLIYDFYNKNDSFNEALAESLFEYRKSHGLRFGLRGTDIDDIYIGLNCGNYEISLYDDNKVWKHDIDLRSFINSIEQDYSSL